MVSARARTKAGVIEYADAATDVAVDLAFAERVRTRFDLAAFEGVRSTSRWGEAHLANGQRMVAAAIAWTPSGGAAARRVPDTMWDADRTGGRPATAGTGRRGATAKSWRAQNVTPQRWGHVHEPRPQLQAFGPSPGDVTT